MSSTHRHLLLDFFWQVISGPPCITLLSPFSLFRKTRTFMRYPERVYYVQSVYKRTYIKSAVELCGSILFLTELCQAVEAGKLDIIDVK
jgi:hypothetical protein